MAGTRARSGVAFVAAGMVVWLASLCLTAAPRAVQPPRPAVHAGQDAIFQSADNCLACHNGLTSASGEDVSIGSAWRASMMANSSRDPYWQAAVRRETIDHPAAGREIEDECPICHMPMARPGRKRRAARRSLLPSADRPTVDAGDGWRPTVCRARCATKSIGKVSARATASPAGSRSRSPRLEAARCSDRSRSTAAAPR